MIALAAIGAAAAAFLASSLVPRSYESRAQLLVGQGLDSSRLDYTQILAAQLQAQTYASLAGGRGALEATIDALRLETTPEELDKRTGAVAAADSRFVEIVASDADPDQAAAIANAMADYIVGLTETVPDATQNAVARELAATEEEVDAAIAELDALGNQSPSSARTARIASVSDRIVALRAVRADLLAQVDEGSTTAVSVVSAAAPAVEPASPRPVLNAALAGVVGIVAAVSIVLFRDRPESSADQPASALGPVPSQAIRGRG